MSPHHTDYLTQLHKLIVTYFDLKEIHTLTFELGIDYETIEGAEKSSKARELIEVCARQSRLQDLVSLCRSERPRMDWPTVPTNFDFGQAIKDVSGSYNPDTENNLGDTSNPFLVGSAVASDYFIGREAILNKIKEHVGSYAGLQSLSLVSNRSMGKTSLLKYVQQNYCTIFDSPETYIAVYIDALDANAYTNTAFMALLRKRIKQQTGHELWRENDDGELALLSEGFYELKEIQGIRLVLLLDEWDHVMNHPEIDRLLYALRANGSQGNIGMITATELGLFELSVQGKLTSNFYNIFSQQYLSNYSQVEWKLLVQEYYARSGRMPHWRDLSLIGELAGGHPYLTQLAGSLVWQVEQERWDEPQVRKIFYTTAEKVIFWNIWRHLDETQIQALKKSLNLPPLQPVPESVVDELKNRGVLNDAGEIFCQAFAQYVIQKVN